MTYSKNIKTAFLAVLLSLITLSSLAESTSNENKIDVFLISDPHVDITSHKTTHLNPPSTLSEELDKASFKTLISRIGEKMDTYQTSHPLILLGDLPAHNAYRLKTTRDNMSLVFNALFQKISPSPFFYIFGNNDSLQRDYGQFTDNGESVADLLKATTGNGDGFLSSGQKCPSNGSPCIIDENTNTGYYSAYLGDSLKLISLNSVLFVSRPSFSPSREGALEELKWFENELRVSQTNNERVILAMHVPPQQWENEYKNAFKKIIKSNPEKILAILAAHTHFDEIHAIKVKTFVIPVVYSASLGTDHGNASSFKTLTLVREKAGAPWQFNNYITYHFLGVNASHSQLLPYYDFMQSFCSNKATSTVGDCLKSHINGSMFDNQTSTLMSEHYTAGNPNNNKVIHPNSSWLSVYL
jgi:hypothetical protein